MTKHLNVKTFLYLALVLALLSSLAHVAYAFSTVNGGNWLEAYISAIAIDVGLVALALGITKRKEAGQRTLFLWGGVLLFSLISTYANWLAGIIHIEKLQPADVGNVGLWLVGLRPILLSAVLPTLVVYLSEVVTATTPQPKPESKATKPKPEPTKPDQIVANLDSDKANKAKQSQATKRRARVAQLKNEGLSQAQIAKELEVHPNTVANDLKQMNGVGK